MGWGKIAYVSVAKTVNKGGRSRSMTFGEMYSELAKDQRDLTNSCATERVIEGNRHPKNVARMLRGKADRTRSADRKAYFNRLAGQVETGRVFDVRISNAGTATVVLIDPRVVAEFRAKAREGIARDWDMTPIEDRTEILAKWWDRDFRDAVVGHAIDEYALAEDWMRQIASEELIRDVERRNPHIPKSAWAVKTEAKAEAKAAKAEAKAEAKAAKAEAKAARKAAKAAPKPGDVVNGHRLDWTGVEWAWTPVG